jgi:biopolymer transport protein ExbD
MRNHRNSPTVNAGSMADIAFLLLIFFLVTTTIAKDKGIARKLPKKCPPGQICSLPIQERNVLRLFLNEKGELLVNDELLPVSDLKEKLVEFIDNNGDGSCEYCNGEGTELSSDNPKKAVISLSTDRLAPYSEFITVQDEMTKAYLDLRERYVLEILEKLPDDLYESELAEIKAAYPFLISEAEIN